MPSRWLFFPRQIRAIKIQTNLQSVAFHAVPGLPCHFQQQYNWIPRYIKLYNLRVTRIWVPIKLHQRLPVFHCADNGFENWQTLRCRCDRIQFQIQIKMRVMVWWFHLSGKRQKNDSSGTLSGTYYTTTTREHKGQGGKKEKTPFTLWVWLHVHFIVFQKKLWKWLMKAAETHNYDLIWRRHSTEAGWVCTFFRATQPRVASRGRHGWASPRIVTDSRRRKNVCFPH